MSILDDFRLLKGSYPDKVKEELSLMKKSLKSGLSADDLLDAGFDEKKIEAINQEGQKQENIFEKYDLTSSCSKRRINGAVKGVKTAREELKGIIPQANIDAYFAFTNKLIMKGGYNYDIDRCSWTTAAAAIWILDELTLENKLDKLFDILPGYDENDSPKDLIVPPLHHPMYDTYLINSLIQLIRHRNTSKLFDGATGALNWNEDKAEKDEDSRLNREKFEQIISLIDPKAIEAAVKKYESKVWEFYKLAFSANYSLEERIAKLESEQEEIERELSNQLLQNKGQKPNNVLIFNPKPETLSFDDLLNNPDRERLLKRQNQIDSELEELYWITFTELSLPNDREKVTNKLKKKRIITEDLANQLITFHVDDPFETAFALLYLLDTKSQIPWYYYGSLSVAYTMLDQLPFDAPIELPENPKLLSEFNDALYKHRYSGYRWDDKTDASGEIINRTVAKNLSQLMFSRSLTLFPRVVSEQPGAEDYLESLGDIDDGEREAYSLTFHLMNAEKLRAGDFSAYRKLLKELESFKAEFEITNETEDIEALKAENTRLRKKNQELITSINSMISDKKKADEQARLFKGVNEEQSAELTDLRELVFILNNESTREEPVQQEIKYPFKTGKRIVSFGGHVSWIKEIKNKLPDVVFISPNMQPNTDQIRNADTIWIQSNCIGHSEFYLIINTARNAGVPIRYYTYASAEKCAEQIVNSIKA